MSRFRTYTGVFAASLLVGSCGDRLGPDETTIGHLSIVPVFQSNAAARLVPVDRLRVILTRSDSVTIAVDEIIELPEQDTVDLTIAVPLLSTTEAFFLELRLINAAGDTVFTGGPTVVTASSSRQTGETVEVSLGYAGPGADAQDVEITTIGRKAFFGESVTLAAHALDSAGQPVPGTPIVWGAVDPAAGTFSGDGTGIFVAGAVRGPARVVASLLESSNFSPGPADTASVLVQPPPVTVAIAGGNDQTGPVGTALTTLIAVRVTASDSLGVEGVLVVFGVPPGGGSLSVDSIETDSLGVAQSTWTLGPTAGTLQATATVPTLAASVTFDATATVVVPVPVAVAITGGNDQTGLVGSLLPSPIEVTVTDGDGAGVADVLVVFGVTPPSGFLSNDSVLTDSAGAAQSGWTLGPAPGPLQATATVPALNDTRVTFDATAIDVEFRWTNAGGGNWSDPANWSNGVVPGPGDSVNVTLDGTYTVNVDVPVTVELLTLGAATGVQTLAVATDRLTITGAAAVGTNGVLVVSGATLDGPGAIVVNGTLTWTGGTITGPDTVTIGTAGTLILGGGTKQLLGGRQLVNAGTAVWTAGALEAGDDITVTNNAGATLDIQGPVSFGHTAGAAPPSAGAASSGTFGPAPHQLPAMFLNEGTVTATVAAAAVFDVAFDNAGTLDLQIGTIDLRGGGTSAGTVSVATGSTLRLGGGTHTLATFANDGVVELLAGSALVTGAYTAAGTVNVNAGTLALNGGGTSNGGITVASGSTLSFGGGAHTLATLTNEGTVDVAAGTVQVTGAYTSVDGVIQGVGVFDIPGGLATTGDVAMGGGTLKIAGPLNPAGAFAVGTLVFTGGTVPNPQVVPMALSPYANVEVAGTAEIDGALTIGGTLVVSGNGNFTLPSSPTATVTVTGDVTVSDNAVLDVEGFGTFLNAQSNIVVSGSGELYIGLSGGINVTGDFTTQEQGVLEMVNIGDVMDVDGDVTFGGGNTFGELIAGTLIIGGSFTQVGTNDEESFHPSGSFATVFDGAAPFSISFDTPGIGVGVLKSHFTDLRLSTSTTVTLGSDVFAHSSLIAASGNDPTIVGNGNTLAVGGLNVNTATFDRVLLQFNGAPNPPYDGTFSQFLNVTFQNYLATDVQFEIFHPGTAVAFSMTGLTFANAPSQGAGAYVKATDSDGATPNSLAVDLTVASPATCGPSDFAEVSPAAIMASCFPLPIAWTWVSGSNTVNQPGVYGTEDVASPSNIPGARHSSASWHDAGGNVWLLGGVGYDMTGSLGNLNDLWRFDGANWTWVDGSSSAGAISGVYGTQGVPSGANVPGSRTQPILWTDLAGDVWLFGGNGYDVGGINGQLNDLWRFDGSDWTWVSGSQNADQPGVYGTQGIPSPTNSPGARQDAVWGVDASDNLWLHGGFGYDEAGNLGDLNDLWRYDGTNWTWVGGSKSIDQNGVYGIQGTASPSNIPGTRSGAVGGFDAAGDFWLFGGVGRGATGGSGPLNDLWRFDGTAWTWISGSDAVDQPGVYGDLGIPNPTNVPGSRGNGVSWIDAAGDFWLFGGGFSGVRLNDMWRFDGMNWTWMSGSETIDEPGAYGTMGTGSPSNAPGGRSSPVAWIDASGNLWLFGGHGIDAAGTKDELNDLWRTPGN